MGNVKNTSATEFNVLKLFLSISRTTDDSNTQVLAHISDAFSFEPPTDSDDDDFPFKRRGRNKLLTDEELAKVVADINVFAEYLRLTPIQTVVFVAYLTGAMVDKCMEYNIDTIRHHFDIDKIECMSLMPVIDSLFEKGYLHLQYNGRRRSSAVVTVDKILFNAIASNLPFAISEPQPFDRYTFCQRVVFMLEKAETEGMSTREIMYEVEKLQKEFAELKFVKEVSRISRTADFPVDSSDATIFYYVCNATANGENTASISNVISLVYTNISDRLRNSNELLDGIHPLQKLDLVVIQPGSFFSEAGLKLTERGKKLFMEADYHSKKCRMKDVIEVSDIKVKDLFFDEATTRQIDFLRSSLDNKQFVKMQKCLDKKSLPKGMAVLLYGAPGTGKTETVMQIAKATGRRIMHVDISQSKSCFLGESEKLIKGIFTNYKSLCKSERRKPILLFNEADAIFSKRRDLNSVTVSQTLNAMQNIILEEMETFEGILIATTNLANNIDEAFDRRFLFKVEFQRPTVEAKQNIWKSKLSMLTDADCHMLAQRYDLSGGEIDNIVRKVTMNEVLHGTMPSFDYIDELCRNERLNARGDNNKVGF